MIRYTFVYNYLAHSWNKVTRDSAMYVENFGSVRLFFPGQRNCFMVQLWYLLIINLFPNIF